MCIIDDNELWYGGLDRKESLVWIETIRGLTLRQAICKLFNTTSGDIKNSPGGYLICQTPIEDMNTVVDDSFIFKHIAKKPKKLGKCPTFWTGLTEETWNVASKFFLIVPHDPNEVDIIWPQS